MTEAKQGTTVSIHYTGMLDDGSTFDTSKGRDPLTFEMGAGQIIPGLEAALAGMTEGEAKTVKIPSEDAYGAHDPGAIQQIPRESVPEHIPLDPGTQLQLQTPDGRALPVVVTEVTDQQVTLDANHPLAGKDLTFAIEVVKVA